ncbi:MAG: hypothetical protein GKR87_12965 [Kiritimatiellae bacterium]|nr:hypothetical protein [Kiritimatiellia bacterium]
MHKEIENSTITLASKVTIIRILSVPLFILLLIYYFLSLRRGEPDETFRMYGLIIFLGVALTDALDGYLARSRNEITKLGCILDPLADKLLLLSALILLTRPNLPELQPQFPVAFTLLVLSRDVVIAVGAAIVHALHGRVEVSPRIMGKLSTAFQMIAIVWVLAPFPDTYFREIIWATGIFTFISGVQYLFDGFKQFDGI